MSNNFQQTVNLKEQMERAKRPAEPAPKPEPKPEPIVKPTPKPVPKPVIKERPVMKKKPLSRASSIDEVYRDEDREEEKRKREFQTIERAKESNNPAGIYKIATIILALALVAAFAYYFLFSSRSETPAPPAGGEAAWYKIELTNGESYYGQVVDTTADPIEIKNVYYDYDQANNTDGQPEDKGANLRIVKMGKETYGPSGTMLVPRAQILKFDVLADNSKVLKAILDYEK